MTIKEFRLSQKLSQAELAAALGISVSSERQYEYGKREPSAAVAAKLKELYGVTLGEAPAPVEEKPAKKTRKQGRAREEGREGRAREKG